MAEKSILAIIYSESIQPIHNATVRINTGPDEWLQYTTDEEGFADFLVDESLQNTQFEVFADGYIPYGVSINLELKGNRQIRVGMPPDPARDDIILPGMVPEKKEEETPIKPFIPLYADGVTLRDPNGKRVSLCGYDMFTALLMVMNGHDLQPFIDESHRYGFNMWRVFGEASDTENGYYTVNPFDQRYNAALETLVSRLVSSNIYLLFTCYADNQIFSAGLEHWSRCVSILKPHQEYVFLSGGNEWQKNGFDPNGLSNPNMKWWSRGSSLGDEKPPEPKGATFVEFHPRRDYPKSLDDTVASATWIQYNYQMNLPLIIDEPPRMGEDGSGDAYLDPDICWQFARHYSSQCAGAVLHIRPGQKGSLIPEGSLTSECAFAWQRGMRL